MSVVRDFVETFRRANSKRVLRKLIEIYRTDTLAKVGLVVFGSFLFLAIFGPLLAPSDPLQIHKYADGTVITLAEPTRSHPFGTTNYGRDLFSQWLHGARISLVVGAVAALFATTLGTIIGLTAAYYGGWVDDVLMRFTDLVYGLPGLPFVIALVFILGASLTNIILVIAFIQWRITARVVRSEALSIKERPYIESARSVGASDLRIMFLHILPNLLPLVILYMALTTAWSILMEASISFLGFAAPDQFSWGRMMYQVYNAGAIRDAWWWVLPPGISIMLLVMSVFFIGRAFEKVSNPDLRH